MIAFGDPRFLRSVIITGAGVFSGSASNQRIGVDNGVMGIAKIVSWSRVIQRRVYSMLYSENRRGDSKEYLPEQSLNPLVFAEVSTRHI